MTCRPSREKKTGHHSRTGCNETGENVSLGWFKVSKRKRHQKKKNKKLMKDNKEHENLSKNLPQKKDISEDKTDATEKETIRSISPSMVVCVKGGKDLLISRIALDQFCTCNKSPVR